MAAWDAVILFFHGVSNLFNWQTVMRSMFIYHCVAECLQTVGMFFAVLVDPCDHGMAHPQVADR